VARFDAAERERAQGLLRETGLAISVLAYYENNLHPDAGRRAEIRGHLKHAIDAARALGVPYVGTFIGRGPSLSVPDNQREAERVLPELVDYAGDRGVRLVIENCVMEGWHPDGHPGNIAYSPESWEWMFSLGLYLNWDPSHLMWLGIDPLSIIAPYADHIVHAHAFDAAPFADEVRERLSALFDPGRAEDRRVTAMPLAVTARRRRPRLERHRRRPRRGRARRAGGDRRPLPVPARRPGR
jgi:sugar phosphate isomerase/epimerase